MLFPGQVLKVEVGISCSKGNGYTKVEKGRRRKRKRRKRKRKGRKKKKKGKRKRKKKVLGKTITKVLHRLQSMLSRKLNYLVLFLRN